MRPTRTIPEGETTRPELAEARFRGGYLCAQAVLSAVGPDLGLDADTAFRVAAAFGGGISGRGETCGAVVGALMAVGLKHGRTAAHDPEREDRVNRLATTLMGEFVGRNGSTLCRDLLGCDLGRPDGGRLATERDVFAAICPGLVRDATEIVERLLELDSAGLPPDVPNSAGR